jgi:hypothetical protein
VSVIHLPTHCATISLLVASIRPKNRSFEVSGCGSGQDERLLGPSSAPELRTPAACGVTEMPSTVSNVVSGAVHVWPGTEQGVAGLSRVSLITIAQPWEELARRVVALLRARIEGGIADERVQVMLEPRPVVRRSTATVPAPALVTVVP